MNLFNKKKTTEVKFEQEKKERALITIIRMFRNDKLKLPETDLSRAMIGFCDQIDPDHKMPERELIKKLQEREDISQYLSSINDGEVLEDSTVKAYAEKYYTLLREVLSSPDSKAWDAWEYQSQQAISILSLKNINLFKEHISHIMDADESCPYYVKKIFNELLFVSRGVDNKGRPVLVSVGPTKDEEKTAEEIMRMVCPSLEKSNKDVFRALVDSLKWRGYIELKRTLEAVEKTSPEKRKLRGRESCVFIETEETVHYVG
jgi:hypothetical protein